VIRHCLYAVDKNPLAVDLCKVALWIEGHAPGLPLSFLDHRIRCGNSLIGVLDLDVLKTGVPDAAFKPLTGDDKAVCTELRKRNKCEREAQLGIEEAALSLGDLARGFAELVNMPDGTPDEVQRKSARYRTLDDDPRSQRLRRACDAWTAAFFSSRGPGGARTAPTTADVWNALASRGALGQRPALIEDLRERFHFFHWRPEFPEVFECGGFDVVLGNPPWERIKLQEKEFFAGRDDEIANAPNAAREKRILALFSPDASSAETALGAAFNEAKRAAEAESLILRECGRFHLTAVGDINSYAIFAETFLGLISSHSRTGLIVPTGIATDDTTKSFFEEVSMKRRLVSLFSFENEEFIFKSVHHSFKFCLLTLQGDRGTVKEPEFVFFARRPDFLRNQYRRFTLSPDDIRRINPNTRTAAVFRSNADAELVKRICERVPVLIDDSKGTAGNPWGIDFFAMFHMANDSGLF
jgi:hypothetical protein